LAQERMTRKQIFQLYDAGQSLSARYGDGLNTAVNRPPVWEVLAAIFRFGGHLDNTEVDF
jgi:hypothetical protein